MQVYLSFFSDYNAGELVIEIDPNKVISCYKLLPVLISVMVRFL